MADLLIIGASTRAAACSALRAGLEPVCADLFADADLRRRCHVERVPAAYYPQAFLSIAASHDLPWMYTGALENHPSLVADLAKRRPLWGNGPEVLRWVRDPLLWTSVLQRSNLSCPVVCMTPTGLDSSRRWLMKPLRSAAGVGIRRWTHESAHNSTVYYQECVEGTPCSAVYVGDESKAQLLGVTRQLVGETWLHARPFGYCGSIGPLTLTESQRQQFSNVGEALVGECKLRGLFGVDCVLRAGEVMPVEINPRYTASIEVLEHAAGMAALELHRQACVSNSTLHVSRLESKQVVGKAILFAARSFQFPKDGPWVKGFEDTDIRQLPEYADIPQAGTRIEKGRPVFTILESSSSVASCLEQLAARVGVDSQRLV